MAGDRLHNYHKALSPTAGESLFRFQTGRKKMKLANLITTQHRYMTRKRYLCSNDTAKAAPADTRFAINER